MSPENGHRLRDKDMLKNNELNSCVHPFSRDGSGAKGAGMDIRNDPDANVTLQPGAAELEWYEAGLANYELSRRPIEVARLVAKRVRRIAEGVYVVRALYLEPDPAPDRGLSQ
jgi:hypothetical protein